METHIKIPEPSIILPISQKIYEIREQKVMLDFDLAELYGVETKYLKRAVNRNIERFPSDFMFQLSRKEHNTILRSQFVSLRLQNAGNEQHPNLRCKIGTSSSQNAKNEANANYGGKRYLPYAFTEQGVAMLSGVINSPTAIAVNITIMRVFMEMRKLFLNHKDLLVKVGELAEKVGEHDQYIKTLYDYLKSFDDEQKRRKEWENRRPIGFS